MNTIAHSILPLVVAALLAFGPAPIYATELCSPEMSLDETVANTQLVILGELHGTQETARFAGEYACAIAHRGRNVVLALEIPDAEQSRIANYLNGPGPLVQCSILCGT